MNVIMWQQIYTPKMYDTSIPNRERKCGNVYPRHCLKNRIFRLFGRFGACLLSSTTHFYDEVIFSEVCNLLITYINSSRAVCICSLKWFNQYVPNWFFTEIVKHKVSKKIWQLKAHRLFILFLLRLQAKQVSQIFVLNIYFNN